MKVSIIISAFNEEMYLSSAIDSVLGQSYQDWQLVLVDDGSSDGTAEIVERYEREDERVSVASVGVRLGKVAAFNIAFSSCDGDIIVMLGGDDLMPEGSLESRVRLMARSGSPARALGYQKILMFSEKPGFKSQVLPRGQFGNKSGPGMVIGREVADRIFPIPAELVSEDIWLAEAGECVAQDVRHGQEVVTHYRVHADNSNPRHKPFAKMTESIHARMRARQLLLEQSDIHVPEGTRQRLQALLDAEEARYKQRPAKILRQRSLRPVDRLAMASMATPTLWKLRTKFLVPLSGWRGRA